MGTRRSIGPSLGTRKARGSRHVLTLESVSGKRRPLLPLLPRCGYRRSNSRKKSNAHDTVHVSSASLAVPLCTFGCQQKANSERRPHSIKIVLTPAVAAMSHVGASNARNGTQPHKNKAHSHINMMQIGRVCPKLISLSYHKTVFLSIDFVRRPHPLRDIQTNTTRAPTQPSPHPGQKIIYINNLHKEHK